MKKNIWGKPLTVEDFDEWLKVVFDPHESPTNYYYKFIDKPTCTIELGLKKPDKGKADGSYC